MFITLEGIDGCGKSLQADLLFDRLTKAYPNREVIITREPGGTKLGETVRDQLLDPEINVSPYAELFLFYAARDALIQEVIAPALRRGAIVVCDRFIDSTVAYQGFGKDVAQDLIKILDKEVVGEYIPHKTFVIDISVDLAAARCESRMNVGEVIDRFDTMGQVFMRRVRTGYTYQAATEPDRITLIHGNRTVEEIAGDIFADTLKMVEKEAALLPVEAREAREASKILAEEGLRGFPPPEVDSI